MGEKMKHLKVLILIGGMLLIVNCKTTPSVELRTDKEHSLLGKQYMESTLVVGSASDVIKPEKKAAMIVVSERNVIKPEKIAAMIVGSKKSKNVGINKGQTTYIHMNEETFMNLLNADPDKLSQIEGIWSNEKKTYKIGFQKAEGKGKYFAFILNSQEPTMKKGEIIAEFIETKYGNTFSTKYYLEDKRKVDTKTYISENGMLMIFLVKWKKESVVFFKNFPDSYIK